MSAQPTQHKANAVGFAGGAAVLVLWLLAFYQPELTEAAPTGVEAALTTVIAYIAARFRKEGVA